MTNGGTSDTNGLMQRISDISWNAVKSDGTITNAIAASTTHSQDLQTQIDAMTDTLTQREATMKARVHRDGDVALEPEGDAVAARRRSSERPPASAGNGN